MERLNVFKGLGLVIVALMVASLLLLLMVRRTTTTTRPLFYDYLESLEIIWIPWREALVFKCWPNENLVWKPRRSQQGHKIRRRITEFFSKIGIVQFFSWKQSRIWASEHSTIELDSSQYDVAEDGGRTNSERGETSTRPCQRLIPTATAFNTLNQHPPQQQHDAPNCRVPIDERRTLCGQALWWDTPLAGFWWYSVLPASTRSRRIGVCKYSSQSENTCTVSNMFPSHESLVHAPHHPAL